MDNKIINQTEKKPHIKTKVIQMNFLKSWLMPSYESDPLKGFTFPFVNVARGNFYKQSRLWPVGITDGPRIAQSDFAVVTQANLIGGSERI